MAIQIGGTTVIDDNLNIININDTTIGVITFYGDNGNVATSGTIYASGGIQTPVEVSSFHFRITFQYHTNPKSYYHLIQ